MKFCVDCEHCVKQQVQWGLEHICANYIDRVTGETHTVSAYSMRADNGRCGPDAKLFKRKQVVDERYRTDDLS